MSDSMLRRAVCWLLLPLVLSVWFASTKQHVHAASAATKRKTAQFHKLCVPDGKQAIAATDRRRHTTLEKLLQITSPRTLEMTDAAQHKAACWMLFDDPKLLRPTSSNFVQRYALVVLYFATQGNKWQTKTNWLSNKDECQWYGVICGRNLIGSTRVTGLELGFNDLSGLLPRELGLLTYLEDVDLHGNEIKGALPSSILKSWKHLKRLQLYMNDMFGKLPTEIGLLSNLRELSIFGNYFNGPIPKELGNLKNLEILDLYANNFEGKIPDNLGKLKRLKELDVHDNDLTGRMPQPVCALKLKVLTSDCLGRSPEVRCDCCTICCQGLPDLKCVDVATRKEIRHDFESLYATEMQKRKSKAQRDKAAARRRK